MSQSWETIVNALLEGLDKALGGRYSAVLYGSAARGDWVAGVSDINLLLVVDDASPATLRSLAGPFEQWRRSNHPPPMLFHRAEWVRAADAFPIEVMDIQHAHRVLRGSDPVAGLTLHARDLRLLMEHELRGKLLQLRRGYLALLGDEAALSHLGVASMPTFLILLRGILRLAGKPVPLEPGAVVREASALIGIDPDGFLTMLRHRAEPNWRGTREQFEAYLLAAQAAASHVDNLQIGAGS